MTTDEAFSYNSRFDETAVGSHDECLDEELIENLVSPAGTNQCLTDVLSIASDQEVWYAD